MNRLKQQLLIARQRYRQTRSILETEGIAVLMSRGILRIKRFFGIACIGNFDRGYKHWRIHHLNTLSRQDVEEQIHRMSVTPLFSIIVPVYNVDSKWLIKMVASVRDQLYPHWQLCLVDDCSIRTDIKPLLQQWSNADSRIEFGLNTTNLGIAETSNRALSMAKGDFIALLDHDDVLSADALLENAKLINQFSKTELIYSDEDKISINGRYSTPFFKPDFSPDLLRSQNYIGHFLVIRKTAIERVGGFRKGYEGAQDYDLILRVCETTEHIQHIPKVLYHWRQIPDSTATAFSAKSHAWEAGRLALEEHCQREKIAGHVSEGKFPGTYRVQYKIIDQPLVSIILPFKDRATLLDTCLSSLLSHTRWSNLEVIAINNNSEQKETRETIDRWRKEDSRIQFLDFSNPFNFSAICNFGTEQSKGSYLVFINNDIEITSDSWLESMLEHAQRDEVGAVGAKLLYPNQTIQHTGIVVGIDQGAGHPFKRFPADHPGYFMKPYLVHNVSAVTAALLMVRRKAFLAADGFDENLFGIAYNDVDFCLKLLDLGLRNIMTPFCTAIHHESSSRGFDLGSEKEGRHEREKRALQEKWKDVFIEGDIFYNPNLTLRREDYSLHVVKPK